NRCCNGSRCPLLRIDKCTAIASLPLNIAARIIEFNGFVPLGSFTYYLTLYSECFSTFPHGTCSLSDSWWYLALEGVYLPLSAALSSNTTPWSRPSITSPHAFPRAYHPLWENGPPSS
ncbi:Uncharacterized protein APZ42_002076, partial [Daphnia magna]